ncbi:glycosyltransferase [Frankia nepalensis]|uniref:glycosyltransferase n=1 Tax=Frankia nepalensis TaxID=1836974 RepID=UPI00288C5F2C|nr:glycosyltransferase [Frankia nepalensis]
MAEPRTEHDSRTPGAYRFSVVVPTYNRRDVVLRAVEALGRTARPWPCELIVVVDGSVDGTADALRGLSAPGPRASPLPLRVVTQGNAGAASARNRGAAEARGEYLLFLDDDMIVDPAILVELDRALDGAGVDAAVGHIPVHPDSPAGPLTDGLRRWAELRRDRLARTGGQLSLGDLLTGQLAVRASVFDAVGGFDASFTAGGTFGGEDTDFLYRLLRSGARARFVPEAVSHQLYRVTPTQYLRQWRQAGLADAALSRKHPGLGEQLSTEHHGHTPRGRAARAAARVGGRLPRPVVKGAVGGVLGRVEAGHTDRATIAALASLRDGHYWSGVATGGGLRPGPGQLPCVLAYHAVEDVADPRIGDYAVPPEALEAQLEALLSAGLRFVGADELIGALDGQPCKEPSLVLTFDDAYVSLVRHAAPVLRRLGIPAIVFAVTGEIGGTNSWDARTGAVQLPLLDGPGLRALHEDGWEVGAHSRSHQHLPMLDDDALRAELAGPRADLAALGLPAPRLFAYPYGHHDRRVRARARAAGYTAAFALRESRPWPSPRTRFALPRVEVLRSHSPQALVDAVLDPPTVHPARVADREARGLARTVLRVAGRPPAARR